MSCFLSSFPVLHPSIHSTFPPISQLYVSHDDIQQMQSKIPTVPTVGQNDEHCLDLHSMNAPIDHRPDRSPQTWSPFFPPTCGHSLLRVAGRGSWVANVVKEWRTLRSLTKSVDVIVSKAPPTKAMYVLPNNQFAIQPSLPISPPHTNYSRSRISGMDNTFLYFMTSFRGGFFWKLVSPRSGNGDTYTTYLAHAMISYLPMI
ncbi:hypothetical protein BGZ63DRAFT_219308 [Mariannaea sp. PMI_226]|nr:hypothetical protein BGZ63DRAFT_219308 [Mariannaea sp. PMI_226]